MADNKGKTKAAILHELESIKGLLREEDGIPILQEAIADPGASASRPLPRRDLDELHDVFQALSDNLKNHGGKSPAPKMPATNKAAGLLDPFVSTSPNTVSSSPKGSTKPGITRQQGSLFSEEKVVDYDQDYLNETIVELIDDDESVEHQPTSFGQSDIAQPPLNYAVNKSITPPPRPALAKANGENPFLPQHIRARLHGNNPPPLFEPGIPEKPAAVPGNKIAVDVTSRQQLIRDVINAVMPQLEQELRQRLQSMSDEQLQDLCD